MKDDPRLDATIMNVKKLVADGYATLWGGL